MTTVRSAISRSLLSLVTAVALLLTSCAAQGPAENADDGANAAPSSTPAEAIANDGELIAEVDEPAELEACVQAEQLEGATVEWLDDAVIEEQRIEGVEARTVEIEGAEVELPGAPEIVIPERIAQAGCIIEYPAPGGCLPAVEISEAFIPGYRVPERRLEGLELPDGTVLEEAVQDSIEVEAVHIAGVREDQVCQAEPKTSENTQIVSSVVRPSIVRPYDLSPTQIQQYDARGGGASNSGTHINLMALNPYSIKPQWLPAAHIPADYLESYVVEGTENTEVAERDEVTAYTTEGDVLFDSDDHELRSDATAELQAITDDIAERGDDVTITVEGHTDNLPSQKYTDNTELSERRAGSVLQWLTDNTDIAAGDMTAKGLGEEHPRASNSSDDGRQQNRRVVITVTPKDYDPSIDYQVDDSQAPAE